MPENEEPAPISPPLENPPSEHRKSVDNPPIAERKPEKTKTEAWQARVWTAAAGNLWIISIGILANITLIGIGVYSLLERQSATPNIMFQLCAMAIVSSSMLKGISVLVGASLCFAGIAISFFAHEKATTVNASYGSPPKSEAEGSNLQVPIKNSAAVAIGAYSPGIVAVIFGCVIIGIAIIKSGSLDCPITNESQASSEQRQAETENYEMPPPDQVGPGAEQKEELKQ
ncbi:hypothetical protein HNP46_006372 [Pseudomonas nitritireducens]|uniref:Uncharacterized protein n=1 Tax=Pseudomonas nitroreducens TaxID=46680 RepID=A0A7W7KRW4_PSENT|nr:hypothetical protein [Pseudomonas nitritireducens]MBB4867459.1 hypothetical protein [Pseudomonas nitritireducens]